MVRAEGGRLLHSDDEMWAENAWDHVSWGSEQQKIAEAAVERQKAAPVSAEQQTLYNAQPAVFWDQIYRKVTDTMYKDRSWLREEFPDLAHALSKDAGPQTVVELGCGPGNTAFPLLANNQNPQLRLHALDFSAEAISMVQACIAEQDKSPISAAVWDLADPAGIPRDIQPGSVDIVICIFVLSALHPSQWQQAVCNIHSMLKPEGVLLFRDYGRHDLVQLRFKQSRLMEDNLYVRGDGTRVYFFEEEELRNIFSSELFRTTKLEIDRRLLLNRKRKLQMWRCWIQGRWQKLPTELT